MADRNFRRNVDPTFRRKTNKSLSELAGLRDDFERKKRVLEEAEAVLNREKARVDAATFDLEEARNELSEAQAEIDADYLPEGAQPRARIQKRDEIAVKVQQAEALYIAQKRAMQTANETFVAAEKEYFNADRAINRFAEGLEDVVQAKAIIEQLDKEKADRLARIEKQTMTRKDSTLKLEREALDAQAREAEEYKRQQKLAADRATKEARKKLAAATAKTQEVTSMVKDVNEQHHKERTEAVLELKANVDAVRAEVATQAEKHNRKVAKAKKQLEDEKDNLLAQGLNPYIEFRKKELAAEAAAREKRLKAAVEKNKADLAAQLTKEQKFLDKQEKAKREAAKYEKEHRESLGPHVIEERNRQYIVSKTSAHTEVLDPSGKAARIDPSQITDVADFTFGLGKSNRIPAEAMKRITENIRQQLAVDRDDLGEYERLVTGLKKATGTYNNVGDEEEKQFNRSRSAPTKSLEMEPESQQNAGNTKILERDLHNFEKLGNNNGIIPGVDQAITAINLNGDKKLQSTLLQITTEEEGDEGNDSKRIESIPTPKYEIKDMSKFERDALDRAKDRHRDRIEYGVPQIAGGKEFSGDAFASTPPVILFKDFEVGKVYKKYFTLTNVSYTFNSFKLLELEDEVIDFFVITFEKPGRMSAGMSCKIEIIYKPQLNKDIFTFVRLLTETGPVNIPLQCLIKRCAPRIITTDVNFEEMVIGQKVTLPVKIVNSQALPTRFTVEEVVPESYSEDVQADEKGDNESKAADKSVDEGELPVMPQIQIGGETQGFRTADGEYIGTEPAAQETELQARVRSVMTAVWRRKKREQAQPFVCYLTANKITSTVKVPAANGIGEEEQEVVKEVLMQEGVLPGYDSINLTVRCAPLTVGFIERQFVVRFHQVDENMKSVDEQGVLVTKEQFITVRVQAEELPIFVEEEEVDLKCTLHDRIYRRKLVVKNRGKTAYRLQLKVMKQFQPYVEVQPSMFFVQAKNSQSINIRLTPKPEIVRKLAHFALLQEPYPHAGLMMLPVEIQVVNQDLPVYFIVKSLVTSSTIEVSEKVIDFGKVYVGQRTSKTIKLRNTSMLPQKIAFVRLKKEFQVSPNEGFAVLLPLEEMEFEVAFGPLSAINYSLDLTLMTSFNDKYVIPIVAEGVEPPLLLSNPVVHMRTTSPGQRVLESLMLTNNYSYPQCFEIMIPEKLYSWVSISPLAMNLNPGETCRVEVEYCPPEGIIDVTDPTTWFSQTVDSSKKSPFVEWKEDAGWMIGKGLYGAIQWSIPSKPGQKISNENQENDASQNNIDESASIGADEEDDGASKHSLTEGPMFEPIPREDWGIFAKWNFPILVKSKKRSAQNPNETLMSSTTSLGVNLSLVNKPLPLYLSLETMVILPQIETDFKSLDFGCIAIATRQLKTFKLYNHNNFPIKVKAVGFNAMGPFTLLRPIRTIAPHESRVVIVECLPKVPGLIVEMLEILTEDETEGGHRLYIPCSVQGLMPTIQLQGLQAPPPPIASSELSLVNKETWNTRSGILDFGHVLVTSNPEHNITIKKFSIKNCSTFAIEALITRVSCIGVNSTAKQQSMIEKTAQGFPIISMRPEKVTIQPNTTVDIEVIFRPDRYRFLPFREDFEVAVGTTDEKLRVGVIGRAWNRQFTVVPDSPLDEPLMNNWLVATTGAVEDFGESHYSEAVRKASKAARQSLQLLPSTADLSRPFITLKFPDPFAKDAPQDSYVIVDPNAAAAGGKGAKGKEPAPVVSSESGLRKQVKKLKIVTAKSGIEAGNVSAAAGGKGSATTFELILSQEAKDSGIWSFNIEKGNVTVGKDEIVEVICTQPKPRQLGGVSVGSWKTFDATVLLKGGIYPSDQNEDNHIPVKLMAFVSI